MNFEENIEQISINLEKVNKIKTNNRGAYLTENSRTEKDKNFGMAVFLFKYKLKSPVI